LLKIILLILKNKKKNLGIEPGEELLHSYTSMPIKGGHHTTNLIGVKEEEGRLE
jgi:hypothetical protein